MRLRRLIALLALATLLGFGAAAAQNEAVITLSSLDLAVGETATVEARVVCGGIVCTTFDVTLEYDPALIAVESVALGDYLGAQAFVITSEIDAGAGQIAFAAAALGASSAPESSLLFTVTIRSIASGQMQFSAIEAEIGDLEPLPVRVEGGAITITAPTPTPTATPDPLTTALDFRGGNRDWTPVISNIDGTVMVLVPVGSFFMGSTQAQIDAAFAECNRIDPQHNCDPNWFGGDLGMGMQTITQPYWIDWTEVSRAQYSACVDAGACSSAAGNTASSSDDQPVSGVTWRQASDYCAGRGARLPTEAEWEFAARGPDSWIYPWGDAFDGGAANHCDSACVSTGWGASLRLTDSQDVDGYAVTAPVISYLQYPSWTGAVNMAGNVWEWTSSIFRDYPYTSASENPNDTASSRVTRGGAYNSSSISLRSADRSELPPATVNEAVGFRCVADAFP